MPLNIIIVGAGIAGLAAAVGLSRQGHEVHVFERRSGVQFEDHGSGIQLQPNVSRILREWDMMDGLQKVAHDNECATVRDQDGNVITTSKYRGHAWYVLRGVLKNLFREYAIKAGAKVVEGARIDRIDVNDPNIVLSDGKTVKGDLIIGADGSWSTVRQALFPDYKPKVMDKACFQASLPLPTVRNDKLLSTLLDGHHNTITLSPGRSIYSSPVPVQQRYEFHMVDHNYTTEQDPRPELMNGPIEDLGWLRKRFSDHEPALRKALDQAKVVLKWRFVEATDVPSLGTKNGKVILIGDSIHAMMPFAGQGSAMGVEDAAVLSTLLTGTTSVDNLPQIMNLYTKIRRPRFERVVDLARNFEQMWGFVDPDMIEARNMLLKHSDRSNDGNVVPDADAEFASPEFQIWLHHYDVFTAVREAMSGSGSSLSKL